MIKITNLTKSFDDNMIFENLNLTINSGNTVILGPSGSGKTTLLRLMAGLDHSYKGQIVHEHSSLSYVFQEDRLLPWKTLRQNIEFIIPKPNVLQARIENVSQSLHIDDLLDKKPYELSGGQKRRCAIARGFIYPSETILMDEPFSSLDLYLKLKIISDLRALLEEEDRNMILITHDINEALLLADEIIIFKQTPITDYKRINIDLKHRRIDDDEFSRLGSEIYHYLLERS